MRYLNKLLLIKKKKTHLDFFCSAHTFLLSKALAMKEKKVLQDIKVQICDDIKPTGARSLKMCLLATEAATVYSAPAVS